MLEPCIVARGIPASHCRRFFTRSGHCRRFFTLKNPVSDASTRRGGSSPRSLLAGGGAGSVDSEPTGLPKLCHHAHLVTSLLGNLLYKISIRILSLVTKVTKVTKYKIKLLKTCTL